MLTHTSGMPDVRDYRWDHPENDAGALERYVRSLDTLALLHDPGQGFRYSNMAYEVLGALVARVSGESFEGYVEHHILAPLGMTGSTFFPASAAPALLARPHTRDSTGAVRLVQFFPYNRAHSPSSNLLSSIADLSRWAVGNLNRGELAGRRILPAASYDTLWRSYAPSGSRFVPNDSTGADIGLSWFLHPYRGHLLVYHGGGDDGFRSMIILVPDTRDAVIMLMNFDAGWTAARRVAWAGVDLLLNGSTKGSD
jgi:CubicO group peptidase (beta-lactamase class C family)